MTGGEPLIRPQAFFAFVLGCCGYIFWIATNAPLRAEEVDAQPANVIPQDEVVVQNEGSIDDLPITYSLKIYKEPDRIKLKGKMSSEEDYKTLMGLVKANFPSIDLSDRVKVKENRPDGEVKIGGLSFVLKLLGYLESGQAFIDNNSLTLKGSASTAVVLTEVKKLIDNEKPTGVSLKDIRITPPEKSWHASVAPGGTVKLSGIVPSRESRKSIFQHVRKKFSQFDIEDTTIVNKDLSGRWTDAVIQSIDLLQLLDEGSVEVTEETIHLKGDVLNEAALKSINAAANNVPGGFALKSEVTVPAPVPHVGVVAVPIGDTAISSR